MATGEGERPGPNAERQLNVEFLSDTDTGYWQITTETSIYVLDLDHRTVRRIPGTSHEHGVNAATMVVFVVRSLAGDYDAQPLFQLVSCVVGERMYLRRPIDRSGVGASTPVRQIRRLPTPGGADVYR